MTVRKGDVIRCLRDIETHGLIHWRGPFTGSFPCTIPAGTVLVVDVDPPEGATGFYCLPRDYHDFEMRHVPSADRTSKKYDGYSFVLDLDDLGEILEVISADCQMRPKKTTTPRGPRGVDVKGGMIMDDDNYGDFRYGILYALSRFKTYKNVLYLLAGL